ncbi:Enoyl-CoA delta isomerase 2, mitochondrial [Strongyloides ratti]|uniref:Enoyl-CoA delta isomerase 2, mitochondrial n=1 Tax=Strongyloides ratti TaxID=34506 RepID=A0A090LM58_STRRB|nr:Enoyl-CoA delta isomerase 2, mitochondrial [Strongyloides ratti]CEF69233.1 Enoyl-CoA delta isomerase 2, mitochondrial [Strongyloides ratti]
MITYTKSYLYNKQNVSSANKLQTFSLKNSLQLQNWLADYCKLQAHTTINDIYEYEILKSRSELMNNDSLDFKIKLPNIKISRQSKAFVITLDDQKNKNALTIEMYEGLTEALNYSLEDRTTSLTVLTGEDHDKPLIGLINGPAIGIMAEVLPLFDYLLASSNANFKTLSVENKCFPGGCSTYTFPHLVGKKVSCDFLTRGKTINAMEAKDLGLINSVVLNNHFHNVAKNKIKQFSKIDPVNFLVIKKLLRDHIRENLYDCLNEEMMNDNLTDKTITSQLMNVNRKV